MRAVLESFAAIWRRPTAILSALAVLVLLALAGSLPLAALLDASLSTQPNPVYAPAHFDAPLFFDLPWQSRPAQAGTAVLWGVLGLLTLLVFPLVDAVLIRAAAGPWTGARDAWGAAVHRFPALLATTACTVVWLLAATGLANLWLAPRLDLLAEHAATETRAVMVRGLADVLWLALALPAVIAATVARATIVADDKRAGIRAFAAGLILTLRRPALIVALAFALLGDVAVVSAAALARPLWDPRTGPSIVLGLAAIVLILAARLAVHAAYLGGVARLVDPSSLPAGAGPLEDKPFTGLLQADAGPARYPS